MKKKDIVEGGHYTAKVSGKLTTVRVDKIRDRFDSYSDRSQTVYDVTNLSTGRATTFRSAQRFRQNVPATNQAGPVLEAIEVASQALELSARQMNKAKVTTPRKTYGEKQQKLADKLRQQKDPGVDTAPHLIVIARAGTGKTTTLVEGLRIVQGEKPNLDPSPQQATIWAKMRTGPRPKSICFVAFNKSIATELQERVPEGCDAMTMHSMGFKSIMRHFGKVQVNSYRVQDIIAELLETDIRNLRRTKPVLVQATERLVSLCKMNLVGGGAGTWAENRDFVQQQLAELAAHYDIDLNGRASEVFALVPRVLERCKDVARDNCIDFADMIWLPIALGLPVYCYDLLLVDEAQDLNRCQQALAIRAGRRLILCGDPKQAIYGFAGADAESMTRLKQEVKITDRGCQTLPLTVTRRCGKAIVEEAKQIVPDFEAHDSCGNGLVSRNSFHFEVATNAKTGHRATTGYHSRVKDGDMILCRVNAPLVSECFKFLRAGRKANIQGRDVGQGLISTIQKLTKSPHSGPATEVELLLTRLSDWLYAEQRKENAKRNPSETRLIALQDRYDCIVCFTEGAETVEQVIQKIENIFTDNKTGDGIKLSSVHKAKGLEAKRVFLLQPEGATIPHPMAKTAWQREQESNLLYVAITRAIEELVYVS